MANVSEIPQYLTVDETAQRLDMTPGRVRQLLRAGRLTGKKPAPTVWLIHARSVDKFATLKTTTGRPRGGYKPEL